MASNHNGTLARMLDAIKERGEYLERDLAVDLAVKRSNVPNLLARHVDKGILRMEHVRRGPRSLVNYVWVGRTSAATRMGPCLGGCGKQIPRDGRVFMCPACRAAASASSPYAN